MANSRKPGPANPPMDWCLIPGLTPGPLGLFDQGDPNVTTLLGDTPGPLGINDAYDPSMGALGSALDYAVFISRDTIRRALENDSDDGRVAASASAKPSSTAGQSRVPVWNTAAADRVMASLLANSERFADNKSGPGMWDLITEKGKAVLDATGEAVDDAGRTLRRAVTIDSPDEARERAERIEQSRAREFRKLLATDLLAHGMIDNGAVCKRLGPIAVAVQPASAHPAYHDSFDQRIARSTAEALELYAGGALINAVAIPILTAGGKLTLRYLSAEAKLSFGLRQELRSSLHADLRPSAKIDGVSPRVGGAKTADLVAPKIARDASIEPVPASPMSNARVAQGSGPSVSPLGAQGKIESGAPVIAGANTTAAGENYGVSFFGDDILPFYGPSKATVGNPNGAPSFFMSLEDSALVKNAHDAAVFTGMAPSAKNAYLTGGDINGFSFPIDGLKVSKPTALDAGGWPHYLEGGNTAVKLEGPNAGYMVNPVEEYITPGHSVVPSGSVLFKVGPDGEWIPLRRW